MLNYVIRMLHESKGHWPSVAAGSGMSKRTIEKIARGEIKEPGFSKVQKLADYFTSLEKRSGVDRRSA